MHSYLVIIEAWLGGSSSELITKKINEVQQEEFEYNESAWELLLNK